MRRAEASRRSRRAALAAGIALLILLSACDTKTEAAAGTTPSTGTTTAPAQALAPRRQVRVVTPSQGTLTTTRNATVTIDPAKQADVASGATGRVAEVLQRAGARVSEGQVVVRLDATAARAQADNARLALRTAQVNLDKAENAAGEGAAQARAALQTANANVDVLQRQVDSGRQLLAAGGMAANDLAALEAQLQQAKSAALQAEDAVARAERAGGEDLELLRLQVSQAQNQVAQAQRAVADASIQAPFAGELTELLVEQGEFVATGTPVFRLASNERQLARFQVPPADASGIVQHGEVHIRYGGLDYAAHVTRTSELPGSARLVEITAELYPSKTRIPTGTITQLSYTVDLATGIQVPAAAVRTEAGTSTVLTVEDGVATARSVRPVAEVGGMVVIEDLPIDAQVIYPVPDDLRAGSAVTVTAGSDGP